MPQPDHSPNDYTPFCGPLYIMTKPAGSLCNLACKYCYYTEKAKLYPDQPRAVMSDALLEKFVKEYIEMQTSPHVLFTWHGGEPLMRPLAFYRKALALQKKYAGGRIINNAIQTNGTLITEEWAIFLKENNFLVGISIDGPQEFHDAYRRSSTGRPSWLQVMQGIRLLNRHGVEWNAMAVVNRMIGDHPLKFYHFFKEIGCRYIQFTPVVERLYRHPDGRLLASPIEGSVIEPTDFSVTPEQWGEFLCTLFDEWVRKDVGEYFIQIFDSTLAGWMGVPPSVCSLAETCGHAAAMEFNGDLYSCDHYVFPEFKLGNIRNKSLVSMMYSPEQLRFGTAKRDLLTRQCKECKFLFVCHGECPRNRFVNSEDGEAGHNYLCQGYYRFFNYAVPYMDFMKKCLLENRPASEVMNWITNGMPEYQANKKTKL